jgi:hypothetical protein
MDISKIQQDLFGMIRNKLPAEASIADELASFLHISPDSAYRRMRGEKLISLDELYQLVTHYQISLDQLMNLRTGGIQFQGQFLDRTNFRFENYISDLVRNMGYINSFPEKQMFNVCKDLPIFHHYHFKEIAAFKWFFWLKTYFQFPEFEQKKFNVADHPDELFQLEKKALELYNQVPSVEIWNIESMNVIFRQIEFYRDARAFNSNEDIYNLYDTVGKLWDHLERQATLGYKFRYEDPEETPMGEYKMYFNEVLMGDNSLLVTLGDLKVSYLVHTTINFMLTRDVQFNENMHSYLQNQMRRSTLISKVSEKERSKFFRIIRERIEKRKVALIS